MQTKGRRHASIVFLASMLAMTCADAEAQALPSEPLTFGTGWFTLGADVSATASCASVQGNTSHCTTDTGFFNYTDYQHSALRMLIVGITSEVKAGDRVSVLAEIRSENGGLPDPYALYVRVRPWPTHGFDIQAGRVPPTFGAFARRHYPYDNLLIGYPLAYQYLTSLRADALPANADELLRMRGRGWLSNFSIGNPAPDNGLPLVHAFRWDTGLQVHAANQRAEATVAVTTGTLANPLVGDDNSGRQIAGRVAVRPFTGLVTGASAARGPFVTTDALRDGRDRRPRQRFHADSVGRRRRVFPRLLPLALRGHRQRLAASAGAHPGDRHAAARRVDIGRGTLQDPPGLYVAARSDHLTFSTVTGALRHDGWDAPVTRLEVGGGYSLQRNVTLKLAYQHNTRQTTPRRCRRRRRGAAGLLVLDRDEDAEGEQSADAEAWRRAVITAGGRNKMRG